MLSEECFIWVGDKYATYGAEESLRYGGRPRLQAGYNLTLDEAG